MSKADEYGIPLSQFYSERTSRDIAELMALDALKDEDYLKRIKYESQTQADADKAIIELLGGRSGNSK